MRPGGPTARLWWELSARPQALLALTGLALFTLVAATAPLLSHDLPLLFDGEEVASPLWRAMDAGDVLWLTVVAAPLAGWLVWRLAGLVGVRAPLRGRCGLVTVALVAVALAAVAATKDSYHETRRYRAELELRRELASLDAKALAMRAPGRQELGALMAEYLDLNDRSHVALSVSPDIEERLWPIQDGRTEAARRAHIEEWARRNAREVERLEGAWFPLNAHAPGRPSWLRMTRPGEVERHALGTDFEGRDLLAQLLWASRTALTVGLLTTLAAAALALLLGGLSGGLGGPVDWFVSRVIEAVACLPMPFMLVVVAAYLPAELRARTGTLVAVLALFAWPHGARLVRAEAARLRTCEYVLAARALGASRLRILVRHILPNAATPLLVQSALLAASVIVTESTLGFLGLGVDAPSWGRLLHRARHGLDLGDAWHLAVFPGAAVFAATLAFNVLGEELRRARDPRS